MESLPETILIVDGISTGQYFAPRLYMMGYLVIHISSGSSHSTFLSSLQQNTREQYAKYYKEWFEYSGDLNSFIESLNPYRPIAVIAGSEPGVELADMLADTLGLPGNDPCTSLRRRNKYHMQDALHKANVPTMRYFKGKDLAEIHRVVHLWNTWPVVIKPVKSAGTDGVRFCNDEEELARGFNQLMNSHDILGNRNSEVLIEECLDGTEYVVNTVSFGGIHYLSDIWEYKKIKIPGAAPIYDYVRLLPYPGNDSPLSILFEYTKQALCALGISHGPAHSEVMMTSEGPRLIETGARVMGASISPDLVSECIGHNQIDWTIWSHLNPERLKIEANVPYQIKNHLLLKFLISYRQGLLRDVPLLNVLPELRSGICGDLVHLISSGELSKTVDLESAPGVLFLKHPDEQVVMADYQLITDLETRAEKELYELENDFTQIKKIDGWYTRLPDDLWLKNEEIGAPDAQVIMKCMNLKPGETVLDIPCGDARVGIHLARAGMHLLGVDINEHFIGDARRRFKTAGLLGEFLTLDMRNLSFENMFDAVVNWFNSFGYFGPETDREVMKRLVTALKPGGRLLIESPAFKNILENVRRLELNGDSLSIHWNEELGCVESKVPVDSPEGKEDSVLIQDYMYSVTEYQEMMTACGLCNIATYDETGSIFSEKSRRLIIVGYKPT